MLSLHQGRWKNVGFAMMVMMILTWRYPVLAAEPSSMHIANVYRGGAMRRGTSSVKFAARGNWDISMGGVDYHHFAALVSTDDNFVDYESDEYTTFYPRSLIWCRIVAITFVLLLMLRTMLPIIFGVAGDNSVSLVMLSVLKAIGMVLAIYVLVKAFIAVRHWRHQQDPHHSEIASSDEENELPLQQRQHFQIAPSNDENELPLQPPQPHFIHVQ
ncbi:hypothetical protein KY290_026432 [Solanum tuberosum]|uniref:Uncharacterized protein n=1 Tax=Solanum tuberosum TaxID=4113 RepID=A0ABQ7UWE1_SOLTU|nr:hypothetical protein KY289_025486 [Solanum tuberosum]KAH0671737.1 hypothetical protein KY284_022824 [Solanum tuberosum]KAH0756162.1 hypothetical protein KY290_026432 [Solanum tuberosum]